MKKQDKINKEKQSSSKKAAMWWSIGGFVVIGTAVTVPLVVLLTKNDKVQPPLTGRYYSLLNDNNRFETIDEAKAYLNTLATKPQVYKYDGKEYNTLSDLIKAFEVSEQQYLIDNDSKISNKTFNYANGLTSPNMPFNGTSVSGFVETTGNPFVGYILGDKVYVSLDEAKQAWVDAQTTNKVDAKAEVIGSAEVITTNTSYSGKFPISLTSATDSNIENIINKLTWSASAPTVIPAADSVATIAFADTGTTAHFVDGTNTSQQISITIPYTTTPISSNEITLTVDKAYVPGTPMITPLSTQVFPTYVTPGYEFAFPLTSGDYSKYLNKTFPHYENGVFNEGTYSNADLATYFDKMVKAINVTSITNNGYDMVYFVVDGMTLGIDVSTVNMPVGWESVNFMQNTGDTPTSRDSKAELVKAMAIQEMIMVNNQAYSTPTNGTPAEYTMIVATQDLPATSFKIIGPADGTEITQDSFISSVIGGKNEEKYYNYVLNYDGNPTSIINNVGMVDVAPQKPTANDLTINVTKNYEAAVAEEKFTINDAPAIQTETYSNGATMPSAGNPVALSSLTVDTGSFNGYVYDGKFYDTKLAAQNAMLQAEKKRPNIVLENTSTSQVIVKGVTYNSIQAAYDTLIYYVDWIGSPDTLSNPSRRIDDLYEL